MKENLNTIIEPINLVTDEKRLAVQRLGFGTINKIFLFYKEPFWNDKLELMNLIWLPENDQFRLEKLSYKNEPQKAWTEDICKFEVVNSYPNALSAWIAGSEQFEKLDDKAISTECTSLLRKFLNDNSIPEPTSILRGSYSHMPLGSQPEDFDSLATPIPSEKTPMVLFAGEATNRDFFSTVHGAYLTGIREAERILKQSPSKSNL